MKKKLLTFILIPLFLIHSNGTPIEDVKFVFTSLEQARSNFDESVVEFYSDAAKIVHREHFGKNNFRENELSGRKYKRILTKIRSNAKKYHDVWVYVDLRYHDLKTHITIQGTRYSKLRDRNFPYELHFSKNEAGDWKIIYEFLETCAIPEIEEKRD